MRSIILPVFLGLTFLWNTLFSPITWAEASEVLQKAPIDLEDKASLQRGAKYFMNYCSGCHSLGYLRYSRLAEDLGIRDADGKILTDIVKSNLMFNTLKINEPILSSLKTADGKTLFGIAPPDLTLETRARSPDWVYTYLKSFYLDHGKVWGVNNLVFKDVAMPHVLSALQGEQTLEQGELVLTHPGSLSVVQYDQLVTDLVNFLTYAAEPARATRHYIGGWVLLFLSLLFVFAYLLKREYWKDIKKY
jgi:ubiquinol-cytochrome c reductase cytochrome c1 subunit